MKILLRVLLSFSLLALFASCKDDSASSNDLDLEKTVIEQAAFGFELNEIINTSRQVTELTGENDLLGDDDIETDLYPGTRALKQQARDLMKLAAKKYKIYENMFQITSADSLAFFHHDTTLGIKLYIGYNTNTGIMRLYSVKYKFAVWQIKTYDSTEIKVDYNHTFDDDTDDKLVSLENLVNYKETFFIQSVFSQIVVTDYDGNEPSGLTLTRDSYYRETRLLQHLRQFIEVNPDGSGSLREDFTFSDGSTAYIHITFYDDHSGVFSKQFRNGSTVSGEFNSALDDGLGSWSELIDFPEGRYIDHIYRQAQVFISNNIFNATLAQQILFRSGRIDSCAIDIQQKTEIGLTTTIIHVEKDNGAFGKFTITESENGKKLDGEWTTWNDYFIESEAQWYEDGSCHLIYRIYAPPYQPGDQPIIVAEYFFAPDGSGDGTLLYNDITYLIKLNDNLKGEISHENKKTEFNLFP